MKMPKGGATAFMRWFGWLMVAGLVMINTAVPPRCLAAESDKQVVHLYFTGAKKPYLVGEERVIVSSGEPAALGRQLVEALINGPTGGNLATISRGTRLRSFFLLEDGTAVVDFSTHFRENHPGGCRQEQLTLFSVVNSLVLNVPAIDRVKILIDGAESETLTGHISLAFPLTADMLLTR